VGFVRCPCITWQDSGTAAMGEIHRNIRVPS
jgi:hypothetical protein